MFALVCLCLAIQVFVAPCALAKDSGYQHSLSNRNHAKDQISKGWPKSKPHFSKPKDSDADENQPIAPSVVEDKPHVPYTGPKFEPIKMSFPDTVRTGAEAEKYKKEKLAKLPARAQKEDKNLKMTGESCARGLGSLYEV